MQPSNKCLFAAEKGAKPPRSCNGFFTAIFSASSSSLSARHRTHMCTYIFVCVCIFYNGGFTAILFAGSSSLSARYQFVHLEYICMQTYTLLLFQPAGVCTPICALKILLFVDVYATHSYIAFFGCARTGATRICVCVCTLFFFV